MKIVVVFFFLSNFFLVFAGERCEQVLEDVFLCDEDQGGQRDSGTKYYFKSNCVVEVCVNEVVNIREGMYFWGTPADKTNSLYNSFPGFYEGHITIQTYVEDNKNIQVLGVDRVNDRALGLAGDMIVEIDRIYIRPGKELKLHEDRWEFHGFEDGLFKASVANYKASLEISCKKGSDSYELSYQSDHDQFDSYHDFKLAAHFLKMNEPFQAAQVKSERSVAISEQFYPEAGALLQKFKKNSYVYITVENEKSGEAVIENQIFSLKGSSSVLNTLVGKCIE